MKITLQGLCASSIENLYSLLVRNKVFELKELLAEINDQDSQSSFIEHKKIIEAIIKEKIDQQITKFKKPLSPALEDFLSEHFPNIQSIFDVIKQKGNPRSRHRLEELTPMSLAIEKVKHEIVHELIALVGDFTPYLQNNEAVLTELLCTEDLPLIQGIFQSVKKDSYEYFMTEIIKDQSNSFPYNMGAGQKVNNFIIDAIENSKITINLFKEVQKYGYSANSFFGIQSGSWLLQISTRRFQNWRDWQNTLILRNIQLCINNIKAEDFHNIQEYNIANTASKFMSSLIDFLIENIQERNSKATNKIEDQIITFNIQLIKKMYTLAPKALTDHYQKLFSEKFFNLRYENFLPGYVKFSNDRALAILLRNIDDTTHYEIIEFVMENIVVSQDQFEDMVTYCLVNTQETGLNFLIKYQPALVQSILKKYLPKIIAEVLQSQQSWDKPSSEILSFAFQFIESFSPDEQIAIDAIISKGQEAKNKSHLAIFQDFLKKKALIQRIERNEIQAPIINMECEIDDSLLAHIHNDHALQGTRELEGNMQSRTLKYLHKFLTESIEGRWKIDEFTDKENEVYILDLKKLQQNVYPALEISVKMDEFRDNRRRPALYSEENCIEEASRFAVQKIIEDRGNLLIPGGWMGLNGASGHAMLYEFRVEKHKWFFIIHNTGAGIDYHQHAELSTEGRSASFKIFVLPFEPESVKEHSKALLSFIRKLIIPKLSPAWGKRHFDEESVYNEILTSASLLGFKEIDAKTTSVDWILGQRSGICTWKVQIAYLKSYPYSHSHHHENVRFEIKRFSLHDYSKTNAKKQTLTSPIVKHQLEFGLQNCARMMNKLKSKATSISKERRAKFTKEMSEMRQILNHLHVDAPGIMYDLPQYFQANKPKETSGALQRLGSLTTLWDDIKTEPTFKIDFEAESPQVIPPPSQAVLFKEAAPFDSFQAILANCQHNHTHKHYISLIRELEKFYLSITNPQNVFQALSTTELKLLLQCLANLHALYASAAAMQDLKPFADHLVIFYRGQMIAALLVDLYFKNHNVKHRVLETLPSMEDLESLIDSPYFITCHPLKNVNMRESYQYFTEITSMIEKEEPIYASYLHAIINESPTILRTLVQLLNNDQAFQPILNMENAQLAPDLEKSVHYYLLNRQILKAKPELQILDENLEACLHFEQIITELNFFREGKLDILRSPHRAETIAADYPIKNTSYRTYGLSKRYTGEIVCDVYMPLTISTAYAGNLQAFDITTTQPMIQEESIRGHLLEKRMSSNEVQTSEKKGVITEKVALTRTLSTIRTQADTQVIATIDFMKKAFGRLKQKDIQQYVFHHLFQFDFFEKQLKISPDIVEDVAQLILKGLHLNVQGKNIKEPAFFFMKLAFAMRKLLSIYPVPENKRVSELFNTFNHLLETQLAYRKMEEKNSSINIELSHLYAFQILNMSFDMQTTGMTPRHALKIFEALIFKRHISLNEESDPFIELQFRYIIGEYIPLLEKFFDNVSQSALETLGNNIKVILKIVGITSNKDLAQGTWILNFPFMKLLVDEKEKCEKLSINLITGQAIVNHQRIIPLPREVTTNPLFTQFFKEKALLAHATPDQKSFGFQIKNEHYQFSLAPETAVLQKLIQVEGKSQFYQYVPNDIGFFPSTFRQFSLQRWVSVEPINNDAQQTVIINPVLNKVVCLYNTKDKIPYQGMNIDRQELINSTKIDFLNRYAFITKVEDPTFLEFWTPNARQLQQGIKLHIKLPRYGIEFEERQNNGQTEFVFANDPRYALDINYPYQIIPGFDAMFILHPRADHAQKSSVHNNSLDIEDALKPLVLIPMQEFMTVVEKPDNEYYLYHFDTQNDVAKRRLVRSDKFTKTDVKNLRFFYFSQQEKYATYKLENTNELIPESTLDRIYLSYVFLAKRLPLLAFNLLKTFNQEIFKLKGEDIQWLRRILIELPAHVALDVNESILRGKAYIHSPEYAAVRLMAAFIIANNKLQYQQCDFSIKLENALDTFVQENVHLRIGTLDANNIVSNTTKYFYGNHDFAALKNILISVYQSYRNIFNNIPSVMHLTEAQESIILKICKDKEAKLPVHLGFRKQMLGLNKINHEASTLTAFKNSMSQSDWLEHYQYFDARLQKVEDRLKIKRTVTTLESQLLLQQVHIKFDPNFMTALSRSSLALLYGDTSFREAKKLTIQDWHLDTRLHDFLYTFFDFFFMLRSETSGATKQVLMERIQQHLYYVATLLHTQKNTNAPIDNLAIILAYVYHDPMEFSQGISEKSSDEELRIAMNDIIATVQKLEQAGKVISVEIIVTAPKLAAGAKVEVPIKPALIHSPLSFQDNQKNKETQGKENHEKEVEESEDLQAASMLLLGKYYHLLHEKTKECEKTVNQLPVIPLLEASLLQHKEPQEAKTIQEALWLELELDYRAGVQKNRHQQAQIIAIQDLYTESQGKILDELNQTLAASLPQLKNDLMVQQKQILIEANVPPIHPEALETWELNLLGLQVSKLGFSQVLNLFVAQDMTLCKKYLHLREADIQKLMEKVLKYLITATHLQHCERILNESAKLILHTTQPITQSSMQTPSQPMSEEDRETVLNDLALLLGAKRCFDPYAQPLLLAFEYLDNKLIYPRQFNCIENFIKKNIQGYMSQSDQLIMGEGKSKLIGPLLMVLKADGLHLSMMEVPVALFNVYLADLNETTGLLGRLAHPFLFDESVDCTDTYLKNLLFRLREIIANRHSLLTTKESTQAFELKYYKLLRFGNVADPIICKKLTYFEAICNLFQESHLLMDEVDSELKTRKQLIHTIGKGDTVPLHENIAKIDLFEFFPHVPINDILGLEPLITIEHIVAEEYFPSPKQWPFVLERLSQLLISHKESPLFKLLDTIHPRLQDAEKEILRLYIRGSGTTIPAFLRRFSPHQRDVIGLYKTQVSEILEISLMKFTDVNMGLSRDPQKQAFELEIALPYIANNIPNEPSRFGHYVETSNFTIKIQLHKPLSLSVIKTFCKSFIEQAQEALGPGGSLKDYEEVLHTFNKLTNLHLPEIDIDNERQFQAVFESIKNIYSVKRYCLCHHILKYVEKNARTARSDAQNHTSQVRSVQGMTGTNWNYRCHPIEMKANLSASLGADGQAIDYLLRHPMQAVLLANRQRNIPAIIQSAFTAQPFDIRGKVRAWIDLGANFKGISNQTIAKHLATYLLSLSSEASMAPLLYVLYFETDNKLYALPISNQSEHGQKIHLVKTNERYIRRKLGCDASRRFTYYDQFHCQGVDITQASFAYAFLSFGLDTLRRDYAQGAFRMRGIKKHQRIIPIIPPEVQDAHPELQADQWTAKNLTIISQETQNNVLVNDHPRSGVQKIRNALRRDLRKHLSKAISIAEKHRLIVHFEEVFFTNVSKTAFEQFKHITTKEDKDKVFNGIVNDTFDQWNTLLKNATILIDEKAILSFKTKLLQILGSVLPSCPAKITQPLLADDLIETEVCIEREEETEKQQELETELDQHFRHDAVPTKSLTWGYLNLETWALEPITLAGGGVPIYTLEFMSKTDNLKRSWQFHPHILVSDNFMNTSEVQVNKLDTYKKDNLFILCVQDEVQQSLKCLLITPEEASQFKQKLLARVASRTRHIWIESSHQTLFVGNKPKQYHENYTIFMQAIALFNADMDVLYQTSTDACWLKHSQNDLGSKLDFVAAMTHLHKDKVNLEIQLRQKLDSIKGPEQPESHNRVIEHQKPETEPQKRELVFSHSRWMRDYLSAPILKPKVL